MSGQGKISYMSPLRSAIAAILFGFVVLAGGSAQTEYALAVDGDVSQALHLGLPDLDKLDHVKVALREHDGTLNNYEGAPIGAVLAKAGLAIGDHVRGKELAGYVLVKAQDGYEVVFGLGELEPTISGRTIVLAYRMDGNALIPSAGPVRLVVEDDKKQARCVRMVTELTVVKLRK